MATVVKAATIPSSIDQVWKVLTDLAAISEWATNVDPLGTPGVGVGGWVA